MKGRGRRGESEREKWQWNQGQRDAVIEEARGHPTGKVARRPRLEKARKRILPESLPPEKNVALPGEACAGNEICAVLIH